MEAKAVAATTSDKSRGQLLRILGVGFGLAVTIGGTIGMGIFRTPGEVAGFLPNAWLFIGVWIAGGIYALLGTLSVAELGTMIPRSGGFYVFAHRALGDYAGFIVGWSDWLSTCGTIAVIAMVIGEYAGKLVPALAGREAAVALSTVGFFTFLQWKGIHRGSLTQNFTSLLKAVVFLILIASCFMFGGRGVRQYTSQSFMWGVPLLAAMVKALQGVIYTYDGWYSVIYFGEEVRNPDRDVPRSMIGGVLAVILIYVLVNVALIYVLPLSELAGAQLATGAAAQELFGARGDSILRVLAIVSMLSTINAYHLTAPRILLAMSRDKLITGRADRVNEGGTPTITLLVSALAAVLFILTGTFDKVLAVLAFFFVINYSISFLSVFVLRRLEPETPRPYRAWGYPWTTGLALVGSVAFLIGAITSDIASGVYENSVYALVLLAASYPVFLLLRWISKRGNRQD
ncbi:MAG TPA: APC family permease [Pyrinomonadaceae bacterium]|nr:APC family permease [Pyrinomonadaceae bacterium]